jgi:hypothetical protein
LRGLGEPLHNLHTSLVYQVGPFKQFEVDDPAHLVLSKLGSNTLHGRIKYKFIGCIHDRDFC